MRSAKRAVEALFAAGIAVPHHFVIERNRDGRGENR